MLCELNQPHAEVSNGVNRGSMDLEDRELVVRFQRGDETAFNELVARHRQEVYFLALGLTGTREDAEDLAQDAFVRAYEGLLKFRGRASFRTWMYRIALNLCLNEIRKRKIRQMLSLENVGFMLASRERGADEVVEGEERQQRLMAAIGRLPPKQKRVFILRYFAELPHGEIAEITGREVGTVKANYFQAVQRLRRYLAEE